MNIMMALMEISLAKDSSLMMFLQEIRDREIGEIKIDSTTITTIMEMTPPCRLMKLLLLDREMMERDVLPKYARV